MPNCLSLMACKIVKGLFCKRSPSSSNAWLCLRFSMHRFRCIKPCAFLWLVVVGVLWIFSNIISHYYSGTPLAEDGSPFADLDGQIAPHHTFEENMNDGSVIYPQENNSNPVIPWIIHQTWDSHNVPEYFQDWIQSWPRFHPEWEYWFWTEEDVRSFLSHFYPDHYKVFSKYNEHIHRANVMRYFIMYHFGGVYADLDLQAMQPLDTWTYGHYCILPEETYAHVYLLYKRPRPNVMITLLASHPKHPFFETALDYLPKYYKLSETDKLLFVDRILARYRKSQKFQEGGTNQVTLAHPKFFLPTWDPGWESKFRGICTEESVSSFQGAQKDTCQDMLDTNFQNIPSIESFTDHHWVHVNLRPDSWKKEKTVNIFDIVPTAVNVTNILLKLKKR